MKLRKGATYYRTPDDDYVFDEFGKLVRIDKSWRPDALIIENSVTKGRSRRIFSDQYGDVAQIKTGIITGIVFVSAHRIIRMIAESGSLDKQNRSNAKDFLLKEGKGGGKLDFSFSVIPTEFSADGASNSPLRNPSPILFLPEGMITVENHMNFGNFLFGAAGYSLGASLMALTAGAHYNSLFNPGENDYDPQFDSRDDQNSIVWGVTFARKHRLRYQERNVSGNVLATQSATSRKL